MSLPKENCFENEHEKEVMLSRNFRRINEEVTQLTAGLLEKNGLITTNETKYIQIQESKC